ncbi:unnamed protein product [Pedinophyceae sp. YPF-701]|nr:unnamed protein product [Pedinophyceae sp. YPF-701]
MARKALKAVQENTKVMKKLYKRLDKMETGGATLQSASQAPAAQTRAAPREKGDPGISPGDLALLQAAVKLPASKKFEVMLMPTTEEDFCTWVLRTGLFQQQNYATCAAVPADTEHGKALETASRVLSTTDAAVLRRWTNWLSRRHRNESSALKRMILLGFLTWSAHGAYEMAQDVESDDVSRDFGVWEPPRAEGRAIAEIYLWDNERARTVAANGFEALIFVRDREGKVTGLQTGQWSLLWFVRAFIGASASLASVLVPGRDPEMPVFSDDVDKLLHEPMDNKGNNAATCATRGLARLTPALLGHIMWELKRALTQGHRPDRFNNNMQVLGEQQELFCKFVYPHLKMFKTDAYKSVFLPDSEAVGWVPANMSAHAAGVMRKLGETEAVDAAVNDAVAEMAPAEVSGGDPPGQAAAPAATAGAEDARDAAGDGPAARPAHAAPAGVATGGRGRRAAGPQDGAAVVHRACCATGCGVKRGADVHECPACGFAWHEECRTKIANRWRANGEGELFEQRLAWPCLRCAGQKGGAELPQLWKDNFVALPVRQAGRLRDAQLPAAIRDKATQGAGAGGSQGPRQKRART